MSCSKELLSRAQGGDRDAQQKILDAHEGLILRVAMKCVGPNGKTTEDMLQEARMAVLLAIGKYDPTRKTAFSTLAWTIAYRSLTRYLASERRNTFAPLSPE